MDRRERTAQFGLDCGDGLLWAGGTWSPGGEYIKKLVIKNVSGAILSIKYKLPATKFFRCALCVCARVCAYFLLGGCMCVRRPVGWVVAAVWRPRECGHAGWSGGGALRGARAKWPCRAL